MPLWAKVLIFAVAYMVAAELGNLLSVQKTFSTFWPPAGLFLAMLLISERRDWPALVLAGIVGNLSSDLLHGRALAVALGFSAANALEALTGALLIARFAGARTRLDSLRSALFFVAFGVLVAPLVGASAGTAVVMATTEAVTAWSVWLSWWVGDAAGVTLLASVILTAVAFWDDARDRLGFAWSGALRPLAYALLIAIPFAVLTYLIMTPMGGATSWKFLITPGVLACGAFGGPLGAAFGVLIIALGGIVGMVFNSPVTSLGSAQLVTQVFQAQAFFIIGSVSSLALAGVIAENTRFAADSRDTAERFRLLFETMREGVSYCRMIYDRHGHPVDWVYLQVNKSFGRITGMRDVIGRHVWEVLPDLAESSPEIYEIYGATALTGHPTIFETDKRTEGRTLRISVTSPAKGDFVSVIEDVTERVAGEQALAESTRRLEKMVYDVAEAMGSVVEARDPYTRGHEVRVATLARRIAVEMGLSGDILDGIAMAALLHDIGKLRVPAEILTKPGQLSGPEFSLIREHSEQGYDILKHIEFPWPVADVVRQHHERMDGSGYPAGLRGDDILMSTRIISVADVIEAMSSHRPYRPALGLDAAVEEVAAHPERFDATVVRACIRLYERGEMGL